MWACGHGGSSLRGDGEPFSISETRLDPSLHLVTTATTHWAFCWDVFSKSRFSTTVNMNRPFQNSFWSFWPRGAAVPSVARGARGSFSCHYDGMGHPGFPVATVPRQGLPWLSHRQLIAQGCCGNRAVRSPRSIPRGKGIRTIRSTGLSLSPHAGISKRFRGNRSDSRRVNGSISIMMGLMRQQRPPDLDSDPQFGPKGVDGNSAHEKQANVDGIFLGENPRLRVRLWRRRGGGAVFRGSGLRSLLRRRRGHRPPHGARGPHLRVPRLRHSHLHEPRLQHRPSQGASPSPFDMAAAASGPFLNPGTPSHYYSCYC